MPKGRTKIRRGQWWVNKKDGNLLEITGTHDGKFRTKAPYGSTTSHTITRKDLLLFFDLV